MEKVYLLDTIDNFANESFTHHVLDKSLENKIFDFSVAAINYVDFIVVVVILSNSSNQICDEICMAEDNVLSKLIGSLLIL